MKKITEIYAFVSLNEKKEGIIGTNIPGAGWMPLVTGDRENLPMMKLIAQEVKKISNKPIKLLKFSQRDELEEI